MKNWKEDAKEAFGWFLICLIIAVAQVILHCL